MSSKLPCPSCGAPLAIPAAARFLCPHCGEELEHNLPDKLSLAQPISTYRELGDAPERLLATPVLFSDRRQHVAAQHARSRFVDQRRAGIQVLVAGALLLVFGAFFLTASILRLSLAVNDWIALAGIALGLALIPPGAWAIFWSVQTMRAWRKEEQALAAESASRAGSPSALVAVCGEKFP